MLGLLQPEQFKIRIECTRESLHRLLTSAVRLFWPHTWEWVCPRRGQWEWARRSLEGARDRDGRWRLAAEVAASAGVGRPGTRRDARCPSGPGGSLGPAR